MNTELSIVAEEPCGALGEFPVPAYFLSPDLSSLATYNASFGIWKICSQGNTISRAWGEPGDIPVPGDINGDGLDDFILFRPSRGFWFTSENSGGIQSGVAQSFAFGVPGDIPLSLDSDGDSKDEAWVFRSDLASGGTLFVKKTEVGESQVAFGLIGDLPVPDDYDGDGKEELAVFRPSSAHWYILGTNGEVRSEQFGLRGDIPSPQDIDGDRKADFVVYRPGESRYYAKTETSSGSLVLGTVGSRVAGSKHSALLDPILPQDFNGDRKRDLVLVRKGAGDKLLFLFSSASEIPHQKPLLTFGAAGEKAIHGDFDGDGLSDLGTIQESSGLLEWKILRSSEQRQRQTELSVRYGLVGDEVLPGDYDGDRKTDLLVVRKLPDGQLLWIPNASGKSPLQPRPWGFSTDQILSGDIDGDLAADYTVVRQSAGALLWLSSSAVAEEIFAPRIFGLVGDTPFLFDSNGDGVKERAIVRKVDGFLKVFTELGTAFTWGLEGDVFLPGGSEGLRGESVMVWRVILGQGFFFIRQADGSSAAVPFGVPGDLLFPVQGVLDTSSLKTNVPSPTTPSTPSTPVSGSGQKLNCASRTAVSNQESGFVWKPVSESNGKLAVLFGSSRSGKIARVALAESKPQGDIILETLSFSGNTNGNRPTFRAKKSGGSYPRGVILLRQDTSGALHCITVPSPGSRTG